MAAITQLGGDPTIPEIEIELDSIASTDNPIPVISRPQAIPPEYYEDDESFEPFE